MSLTIHPLALGETMRTKEFHGLPCPKCDSRTWIIDSRYAKKAKAVYRRHQCDKCKFRFTTYESIFDKVRKVKQIARIRRLCKQLIDELEEML